MAEKESSLGHLPGTRWEFDQSVTDVFDDMLRRSIPQYLGVSAELSRVMVDVYHSYKARGGYGTEEIERKRLALEGVLVPVTAHWNAELLRAGGFNQIDSFWRWMNFAGWVAVKGP